MRRPLSLLLLGLLALVLQGGAVRVLPGALCPDLGLLVVLAAGLSLTPATGLGIAAALGWAADLLSGALLGQHALLRVVAFAVTRIANRQLDLRRRAPLWVLALALSAGTEVGVGGLSWLMGGAFPFTLPDIRIIVLHAVVTAFFALPVVRLVERVQGQLTEGGTPRRVIHLDGRGRTA